MTAPLTKARLIELDDKFEKAKPGGKNIPVQFNPETLKITYANQIVEPKGGDKAAGTAGRQFVGAGTTKLALQLWFDVTALDGSTDPQSTGEQGIVDDVRRLTQHVVYFMTPIPTKSDPKILTPPGVDFSWGTFSFKGMVEAMEESIEFFSPDGKPLRASISITLSQQKILARDPKGDSSPLTPRKGHTPLTIAKQGDSVQQMAGKNGVGDWQSIASGNGIEDPLRIAPGALIDLTARADIGADAGLSISASATLSASVSAPSASLNASFGASTASLSLG